MNNKIKQVVTGFKDSRPDLRIQDIAAMVFPEKKPKRAREILSRWLNGHDLEYVRVKDIVQMCKVFKVEPNDLI